MIVNDELEYKKKKKEIGTKYAVGVGGLISQRKSQFRNQIHTQCVVYERVDFEMTQRNALTIYKKK